MSLEAIDSSVSILGHAAQIVQAGYHGFIRYVSPVTSTWPTKQLTSAEISEIKNIQGTKIGLCYEYEPKDQDYGVQLAYFTQDQAVRDANRALGVCSALGVPSSVPVFFGVDWDFVLTDINGSVLDYFTTVHSEFDGADRLVGIYGSGASCRILKTAGVVHYTWMAYAPSWLENNSYQDADIVQGDSINVVGFDVDPDEVANTDVLW